MKKIISTLVLTLLVLTSIVSFSGVDQCYAASSALQVTVNGSYVKWTDAYPYIDSHNRTQVPLRASMEACGLNVSWDDHTRTAVVTDGKNIVEVPIGSHDIIVNRNTQYIDTVAQIRNDRTYLPIRAVAEAFGWGVYWSENAEYGPKHHDYQVSLVKLDKGYISSNFTQMTSDNKRTELGDTYVLKIDKDGKVTVTYNNLKNDYDGTVMNETNSYTPIACEKYGNDLIFWVDPVWNIRVHNYPGDVNEIFEEMGDTHLVSYLIQYI